MELAVAENARSSNNPPRCCWAKVWATPFCASSMAWKSIKPTCSHYGRLSQWTLAIGVLAAHDKQFNDTIILQVLSSAFFRASARRFLSARASLHVMAFSALQNAIVTERNTIPCDWLKIPKDDLQMIQSCSLRLLNPVRQLRIHWWSRILCLW